VEAIKRGVMLAGGLPVDFPTISIHESFAHPTSMYLRNLMSMDTEEMIRAQPMDAVVMIGGCDKTVPAQLMGAASANVPCVQLVTGPMLTGSHRGERVGACTDCRRYWGRYRAEEIDAGEITQVNDQLGRKRRHVLGDGDREHHGLHRRGAGHRAAGKRFGARGDRRSDPRGGEDGHHRRRDREIEAHARPDPHRESVRERASRAARDRRLTNGVIHTTAIAGRLGIHLDLDRLDAMGRETPVLVDLKPSGQHYMEDLHRAGGLPTLLRELKPLLHLDALTVTGRTLGEEIDAAEAFAQNVVRPFSNPIYPQGGIAVLRGNLAPGGAIIKQSAADPKLMKHEGRAVVFENAEDLARRVDADDLDVKADDILVLKNIGPKGAPGMPEAGYLPIPKKLARQGVKDMVRISDGRMSGTAAGTIVLHVTPESATGGPLAWVRNGDRIRLDVAKRELELMVPDAEMSKRRQAQPVREPTAPRGYLKLFLDSVTQADQGVDFDFLRK
jgi:dihydroxy-acid dehydratase